MCILLGCRPLLSFFGGGFPYQNRLKKEKKEGKTNQKRVPTYSSLSNLEDLVGFRLFRQLPMPQPVKLAGLRRTHPRVGIDVQPLGPCGSGWRQPGRRADEPDGRHGEVSFQVQPHRSRPFLPILDWCLVGLFGDFAPVWRVNTTRQRVEHSLSSGYNSTVWPDKGPQCPIYKGPGDEDVMAVHPNTVERTLYLMRNMARLFPTHYASSAWGWLTWHQSGRTF